MSDDEEILYSSLVHDYSSKYLFLSVPTVKRKNILIPQDTIVDVFYVEKNKPYYFTSKVIGNFSEDGNIYLVVERPFDLVCYDRRKFARVKVIQKVKIVDLNSTPSILQGEILDLSGSSAKIKVKATGLRDKNYLLQFKLGSKTFHILGYPQECEVSKLVGNERLYSIYVMTFSKHDADKIKTLTECIERLADVNIK
ncbi:flagellar brake protein [bacterium]|nr:flagellar brake protein [bacterium]